MKEESSIQEETILFHGINYESNESTDFKIKRFLLEHLQIEIKLDDIDRSHRLGKKGPIIVKFVRHNLKHQIYSNKRKLKGKNYFISESLTAMRTSCVKLLESSRKEGTILSHWTSDGEVFYIKVDKPETICRMTDFARAQF